MAEEQDPVVPSVPPPMPAPAPEPASAAPPPANSWATPPPQPTPTGVLTADEKNMGMLCHLLSLAGIVIPVVGNIVGPLVIWLMKKEQSAFVDANGKESLNFQITVLIAVVVSFLLCFVLIGLLLLPAVSIAAIVFAIIAGIKASNGEVYRYPVCIRFIK